MASVSFSYSGGGTNLSALLFMPGGILSTIRFDLWKRFMLENRVMKDMGKKDQEEERWPVI